MSFQRTRGDVQCDLVFKQEDKRFERNGKHDEEEKLLAAACVLLGIAIYGEEVTFYVKWDKTKSNSVYYRIPEDMTDIKDPKGKKITDENTPYKITTHVGNWLWFSVGPNEWYDSPTLLHGNDSVLTNVPGGINIRDTNNYSNGAIRVQADWNGTMFSLEVVWATLERLSLKSCFPDNEPTADGWAWADRNKISLGELKNQNKWSQKN